MTSIAPTGPGSVGAGLVPAGFQRCVVVGMGGHRDHWAARGGRLYGFGQSLGRTTQCTAFSVRPLGPDRGVVGLGRHGGRRYRPGFSSSLAQLAGLLAMYSRTAYSSRSFLTTRSW